MVLVDAAVRGRGIGKALMNHALRTADELGARTLRLDATPLGRPLYESLGFVPQFELTRWSGVAKDVDRSGTRMTSHVRPATSGDAAELLNLDRSVTHTERSKFLSRLFAEDWSAVRVAEASGKVGGYFTMRRGSEAIQLGPCIAEDDEAGRALVADALRRYAGSRVYWDAPSGHITACELAGSASLAPQRTLLRMCRGEQVSDDIQRLWASSGPELG
jgi:hypothetical protein